MLIRHGNVVFHIPLVFENGHIPYARFPSLPYFRGIPSQYSIIPFENL